MKLIKRLTALLLPLLMTPVFGFLIAESYLNFGGGEKDLLVLIPWILWSLLFLTSGLALWRSTISFKVWLLKSALYSILVLLVIWLSLLIYSIVAT